MTLYRREKMIFVETKTGFLCIGSEEEVQGESSDQIADRIKKAAAIARYNEIERSGHHAVH